MNASSEKNLIQSVCRAVAILRCFHDEQELSLAEISSQLGIHKSTVSGIVNTLRAENFLEQDNKHGKYKLGLEIFRLAMNSRLELSELCDPYMEKLLLLTGETVTLGVYDGAEGIVYSAEKKSIHSLALSIPIGAQLPIHSTALGKAVLAAMEEERAFEIIAALEIKPKGKNGLRDAAALRKELGHIRQTGIAYDMEEYEPGLICVSSPIFYKPGKPVGAISIAGPTFRLDEEKRNYIGRQIREVSLEINKELCKI